MRGFLLCTLVLLGISFSSGKFVKPHPLSDEFIDLINSKQSTWKAGRNFDADTPLSEIRGLLGVLPKGDKDFKLPYVSHRDADIPESFDARDQWPECADIIGNIRDQAACGSCWAVAAAESMSDRICIHSDASVKLSVSAEDLMTCCYECGDGCNGGWLEPAFDYWATTGIVTGGGYHSHEGCKSYSIEPCDHHVNGTLPPCGDIEPTPECVKKCDSDSDFSYADTLTRGQAYKVLTDEKQIQTEIMKNGPVEAAFTVYEDFLNYKSGVYQHVTGGPAGGHAVKIMGWGFENDTPYWLIANSWNSEWGDNGYFKFLRGENHCGMEEDVVTGLPQL